MNQDTVNKYRSLRLITGENKLPGSEGWKVLLDEEPDVIAIILGDIAKQSTARPKQVGQRPMPNEASIPEFIDLIAQRHNAVPMQKSMGVIMAARGVSERTLAKRLSISRTTLQKISSGDYDPPISVIEEIAQALAIPPSYFPEYRLKVVFRAIAAVFEKDLEKADGLYGIISGSKQVQTNGSYGTMAQAVRKIHAIAREIGVKVEVKA